MGFGAKNGEKMEKSKNFGRKIFLDRVDSESLETYFKTIMSKSKIFSHHKIFLGFSHFFTILALLAEKRQSPSKKILHGKKFSISRFSV